MEADTDCIWGLRTRLYSPQHFGDENKLISFGCCMQCPVKKGIWHMGEVCYLAVLNGVGGKSCRVHCQILTTSCFSNFLGSPLEHCSKASTAARLQVP